MTEFLSPLVYMTPEMLGIYTPFPSLEKAAPIRTFNLLSHERTRHAVEKREKEHDHRVFLQAERLVCAGMIPDWY